jgi:hypothetical protein
MDVAHQLLVLLHLVAFAALLGGALVQLRDPEPEINAAMLHGSWLTLLSGLALWLLAGPFGSDPELGLVVAKLVLSLFVTVLAVRNRRYLFIPRGLLGLIIALVLASTVLSVVGR